MVTWPSGKAAVCKTAIRGFDSRRHLKLAIGKLNVLKYHTSVCFQLKILVYVNDLPLSPQLSVFRNPFYTLPLTLKLTLGFGLRTVSSELVCLLLCVCTSA